MQRADRIIVAGIAVAGLYGLVLLPLFPLLGSSHPALLELVRGSTASIINMGARASVGQTSFALAVVAGRSERDDVRLGVLVGGQALGRPRLRLAARPRRRQRPSAVWRACTRWSAASVPWPSCSHPSFRFPPRSSTRPSVTVACALRPSSCSTWRAPLLWTGLLATLGYELGQDAVDVTDAIAHYSLWATLALIAAVIAVQAVRGSARRSAPAIAEGLGAPSRVDPPPPPAPCAGKSPLGRSSITITMMAP